MADYTNDPRVKVAREWTGLGTQASTRLLIALDAVDPARQWRPISEAPRDGSSVLGYVEGCVPFVTWYAHPGFDFEGLPTHFLPLPAPPEAT